jgi:hypothetical protein
MAGAGTPGPVGAAQRHTSAARAWAQSPQHTPAEARSVTRSRQRPVAGCLPVPIVERARADAVRLPGSVTGKSVGSATGVTRCTG